MKTYNCKMTEHMTSVTAIEWPSSGHPTILNDKYSVTCNVRHDFFSDLPTFLMKKENTFFHLFALIPEN